MSRLRDRLEGFPRFFNRPSRRQMAQERGLERIDRLSFNESPLGPSPAVRDAVREESERLGDYPTFADDDLRAAIAAQIGRGLGPEHLLTGAGAYEVLELLTRSFVEPGEEVVLSLPTFEASPRIVGLEGGEVVDVPLLRPSFRLDVEGLLAAVTERTRMVWVCNPNNPSGVGVTAAEMATHFERLPERVILLADEAYHQFVRSPDAPDTLAQVAAGRPNLLVVHSLSKAYGLAGLRLGYALGPPELLDLAARRHRAFHLSRLHLAAGIAAVGDARYVERVAEFVLGERDRLQQGLRSLGLEPLPSETNFLCVELPVAAQDATSRLTDHGVLIRPLDDLGLERHVRINVGSREANDRLLAGLKDFLTGR
ncbi:MAG: histidinol-phosphate transaminase [Acidobacteriota bacterium]